MIAFIAARWVICRARKGVEHYPRNNNNNNNNNNNHHNNSNNNSSSGDSLARKLKLCHREVVAEYLPAKLPRLLWHGGVGEIQQRSWPVGPLFFFMFSQSFEKVLVQFTDAAGSLARKLRLGEHMVRPLEPAFFPADVSLNLAGELKPVLNLASLGTYLYQELLMGRWRSGIPAATCWGAGYMPELCCYARIPQNKLAWCFGGGGSDNEMDEYAAACCAPFTYENTEVPLIRGAPLLLEKSSASNLSVHIFLQTFHEDKFAVLQLLESIDRFWPTEWNSTVFLAVDATDADEEFCASISRDDVRCIFTPSIGRGSSVVDPIEFSGRSASKRYKEQLLQYHYLLADLYIAELGYLQADWLAFFDADVVLHSSHVPELLFVDGRPVMHGRRDYIYSTLPLAMGMDWVAEFMDSFPIMVRPSHLQDFRLFHQELFGDEDGFQGAYLRARARVEQTSLLHARHKMYLADGECPFTSLPTFLYYYYHSEYAWSLEDGALFGLPGADSCLALRVASHLNKAKHHVKRKEWSEAQYEDLAQHLMSMGSQKAPALWVALLSANFDENATWSQQSSAHCLHRDREAMLKAYFAA
ncbi:unnamed protein product [Polarella glacialis]|uniref:Uncharacterized protein n=1 Tax=Polarella glacialis TaxID=89957 RepID=A0A813FZC3_POLGL|nr:unnamed protein product [Polarella glacialis]